MKRYLISIYLIFAFVNVAPGFMQPSFDEFSSERYFNEDGYILTKNSFKISAQNLKNKHFARGEDVVRYLPFLNLSNFGANKSVDFRASQRATLYLNGVKIDNALPFYFGFSPLNTINSPLLESVEFTPGAGAVLYGSGAKGGVAEFSTLSNSRDSLFSVGGGYSTFTDGGNPSYNAYAIFKDSFGDLFLNFGLNYSELGGQRLSDKAQQIGAKFGFVYDFNHANRLKFSADFYRGEIKWAGLNTYARYDDSVYDSTMTHMHGTIERVLYFYARMYYMKTHGLSEILPNENTDKTEFFSYNDEFVSATQTRLTASLGYEIDFSSKANFNITGFFHQNSIKTADTPISSAYFDFQSLVFKDQNLNYTGNEFSDNKFGLNANFSYAHENGKFTLGTQNIIENDKSIYARDITGNSQMFCQNCNYANADASWVWRFAYQTKSEISSKEMTNAVFATEQYRLNKNFHIFGGVRYERHKSEFDIDAKHINEAYYFKQSTPENYTYNLATSPEIYNDTQTKSHIAFELMPSFRYSISGSIYARYERGYTNLPPLYAFKRTLSNAHGSGNNTQNTNIVDISWEKTKFDDEIYDSFELGFRDFFSGENFTAIFSANAFYTLTNNEFYATRNFNPVVEIFAQERAQNANANNANLYFISPNIAFSYDKTRRIGLELNFTQYLFGGVIAFNESLAYTKAEFNENGQWQEMLYNPTYKATLGVKFEPFSWINLWAQGAFFGAQKVLSTKGATTSYNGFTNFSPVQLPTRVDQVWQEESAYEDDLKAYALFDVGVSMNLWGFRVDAGVRNLTNTFYYDYYNRDSLDKMGFGYLIGTGRSYFVGFSWEYN